jgi:SAM-dependent methyltransferase
VGDTAGRFKHLGYRPAVFRAHWERESANWIAWVRRAGNDAYRDYAPAFFEDIVPGPRGPTLEMGCGEGRVARDLAARGHRVVGVDVSPTLIAAASDADAAGRYLLADAARLPFPDGSFDLVVAYNSLMDLDDLAAAVAETARVLTPTGVFAVCVVHPIADAGAFDDRTADAAFRITETYLEPRLVDQTFSRDGLTIRFAGMAYPLEGYGKAFESAGFAIERLREPAVAPDAVERDPGEARWSRLPLFLFLRLVLRG